LAELKFGVLARDGYAEVSHARREDSAPGVGATCTVCELPIKRDEMEFEIEFARDGANPGLDKFHVHIRCFAAPEFERRGKQ
jgi:hypothetical protein